MKTFKTTLNIICFWFAVSVFCYGFAKFTQAVIINSTINSTTIGASTPSSAVVTSLVTNTSAQFNGSMAQNGTAFKFVEVSSCTTAASAGASCTTVITWPTPAFVDNGYIMGCSGGGTLASFEGFNTKTATTAATVVTNTPGNTTAISIPLDCWAWHP